MGYRPQTLDNWKTQSYHAAPLGMKAVEDAIRELAEYDGVEVVELHVTFSDDRRTYRVAITHKDKTAPMGTTLNSTVFTLRNFRPTPITDWQEALADIKARQANMPPHLRGYPVDVDEATYQKQLADIREATDYDVALNDFAMWRTDGGYGFCYITRQGGIAFQKWAKVRKIPVAVPVPDDTPTEAPAA